jgi:TRAP-type C4-dicarboxylate transport system substrate-binding protein
MLQRGILARRTERVSKKWFESLPKNLQRIITEDAATQIPPINSFADQEVKKAEAEY